jgi:hypothetical protein
LGILGLFRNFWNFWDFWPIFEISAYFPKINQISTQNPIPLKFQKRTAFVNKYDVVAEYKLQQQTQQRLGRVLDLAKAYYYWNTDVTQNSELSDRQQQGREGQVHATVVIDPITQQHANISLRTPQENIRIRQVQLPSQVRPFPLVRHTDKPIHAANQLFSGLSVVRGRAECTVDGQRVQTFDDASYRAPISHRCQSVLAKDCSGGKPKFAVTMKALGERDQQQNAEQQYKVGWIFEICDFWQKDANFDEFFEISPILAKNDNLIIFV